MNPGLQPPGAAIFLVKCADFKCLAVRNANGKWNRLYDDTVLPDATEAVISVPLESVLPFLPEAKREQLCPVRLRAQS